MNAKKFMACGALLIAAQGLWAQTMQFTPSQNVAQLTASGTVEVQQDLLILSMNTTKEGSDAGAVQSQLKVALDAALAEAKKAAQPGQLDVRTGNFNIYPRYGRDGKINGWHGATELILEGKDFARITGTAGKIQSLTMGGVSFGLSRDQRAKVEGEAQSIAIERFKAKALEIAKAFGFSSYTLREVSINSDEQGGMPPRPRIMAMEAKAASADMPVPVEAGKSTVAVTVSGSVQMK
jgi:predicted secreted protein